MEDLFSNFGDLLSDYSQHREYIRRATAQAKKFSKAVIEKVVLDHEVKASSVADQILPLVPDVETHIAEIDGEVETINTDKSDAEEQYQELELRMAIGEITDEDFGTESADLKSKLDAAEGRLGELSEDRSKHADMLSRWAELAAEGQQDDGISASDDDTSGDAEADEGVEEPVVVEDQDGTHASTEHIKEDVSSVFQDDDEEEDDDDSEEALEAEGAEEVAIEAGDADVDFGFEEDEGAGEEVELNLVDGAAGGDTGEDEIGIDLDVVSKDGPQVQGHIKDDGEVGEEGEDSRRALLLYQEGTADEQIYPFTGEVLTIGRGRDNDIQIKNDSKVSRFHCKLFRRGGNFYVEDNKSSNGTLVNGELITERRLFGGEEVIIGETFFRFRIM
jgi:hypothetical protein